MMRQVRFTKDMRPGHTAGDTRIVPDDVAQKLVAEGVAEDEGSFPETMAITSRPQKKKRPTLSLGGNPAKTYETR